MKILEKFRQKQENQFAAQPVIAFLGDSVTQGCFEIYTKNGRIEPEYYPEESYSRKLQKILELLYPSVNPIIINAGISGDNAASGLSRDERDILAYKPALVVVCYGLNDACSGQGGLDSYRESLRGIFKKLNDSGAEVIFMTPNLRINDICYECPDKMIENCALNIAANENEGWLEGYIDAARGAAAQCGVKVCDCYRIWQKLRDNGVNTNALLSNAVNHPTRELHWMFAYELMRMMLED